MAGRAAVVLDHRFWSKTVAVPGPLPTPCRVWVARIDDNGKGRRFGRFWFDGRPVVAYVAACAEAEGKSLAELKGSVVLHRCDNPLCVEPGHVYSGTQKQNIADMIAKGRAGGWLGDPSKRCSPEMARLIAKQRRDEKLMMAHLRAIAAE